VRGNLTVGQEEAPHLVQRVWAGPATIMPEPTESAHRQPATGSGLCLLLLLFWQLTESSRGGDRTQKTEICTLEKKVETWS
jgi:hypothetical protein